VRGSIGKNGNKVLSWEWDGNGNGNDFTGMGGNGNSVAVIPAHLYSTGAAGYRSLLTKLT